MKDFEAFYITWYSRCYSFAKEYIRDESEAQNIVHDVFLYLYEHLDEKELYKNPAYLLTSIKNKCLDYLRRKVVEQKLVNKIQSDFEFQLKYDALEELNTNFPDEMAIEELLGKLLEKLPKRCREIFVMNKLQGIKQKQIAQELEITVNTVETQMGIAYRILRRELKDYLPLLLFFMITK